MIQWVSFGVTYVRSPWNSTQRTLQAACRGAVHRSQCHHIWAAVRWHRCATSETSSPCRGRRSKERVVDQLAYKSLGVKGGVATYSLAQLLPDEGLEDGEQHVEDIRVVHNVHRLQAHTDAILHIVQQHCGKRRCELCNVTEWQTYSSNNNKWYS